MASPGGTDSHAAPPKGKPILIEASVSLRGSYAAGGKYALEGYELFGELVDRPVVQRAEAILERAQRQRGGEGVR